MMSPSSGRCSRRCWKPRGYRVFTAASGEEGLDQAHRVKPAVILLNVLMPRLDGFEVCARLKRDPATQPIPVVLLTASEDPKLYAKAVQAGATIVLPKTTPPERLLHGIELVLPRPNSPPQDLD
ncbi:MAG: response regulator [candidate division NC10 bacterium]|nr:response regulator [candidate division NC10 bacterium]